MPGPLSKRMHKVKGGWKVRGESKTYKTKAAAIKRLRQRQFFENAPSEGVRKKSLFKKKGK